MTDEQKYGDFVTHTQVREHPEWFLTDAQLALCDQIAKELSKRMAETLSRVLSKDQN